MLYSSVMIFFITSCSLDKKPEGILAYIDVTKSYPEKEILLTDIADVSFLHLSTTDDDYLYKGRIRCITENTVVVYDNISGSILLFSKNGTPKSRFNHKGQGPGEYTGFITQVAYDEKADEVFVSDGNMNNIQVYSSIGEHKRTIALPHEMAVFEFIDFDDRSLFFVDRYKISQRDLMLLSGDDSPKEDYVIPFYRISKTTGEVLDCVELPGTHLALGANFNGRWVNAPRLYSLKCPEGILLGSAGTDTVFLYKGDKSLTPVICQTPPIESLNPVEFLDICLDRGNYQFLKTLLVRDGTISAREKITFADFFPTKYYVRNKKTGEISRQKFLIPDYKGKEFIIDPSDQLSAGIPFNKEYCIELSLYELKQAYRENKLGGKLKELVATLNEDEDNNVFMLVDFK